LPNCSLPINIFSLDSVSKLQIVNPVAFTKGILKIEIGNINEFGAWVILERLELDTTNSELRDVTFEPDSVILLSYDTALYRIMLKKCFKHLKSYLLFTSPGFRLWSIYILFSVSSL
jgi:hypothetical protein